MAKLKIVALMKPGMPSRNLFTKIISPNIVCFLPFSAWFLYSMLKMETSYGGTQKGDFLEKLGSKFLKKNVSISIFGFR